MHLGARIEVHKTEVNYDLILNVRQLKAKDPCTRKTYSNHPCHKGNYEFKPLRIK